MTNPFVSRIGGIMSADIAVPQHERMLRFYVRVLGTGEEPLWREDLMNNVGLPVIGLGASSPDYAGLPLQWMPHIQVEDIARSVEHALHAGASEVLHGKDDDGKSHWAVLLDPDGAAFGLIPVVSEADIPSGAGTISGDEESSVGCIAWLDLTVKNASASRDFYRKVVGWSVQDAAMEDEKGRYADYCMVAGDGNAVAGICHARGTNLGLPPVWMLYLPVGDLTESRRRVKDEGGKVIKETRGVNADSATVVIEDPVGIHLALVSG